MNRIDNKFIELRKARKKAFIAFITAGDPNLKTTVDLVLSFEKSGVDIVELGVPFSDPLADGPTIQASSERALKHNVDLNGIFNAVRRIRRQSQIPICLMTYFNPVFHYGQKHFVQECIKAGVDGVIVPDLPPEEADELVGLARRSGLATVFFLSPTTTTHRMPLVAKQSSGFIYFVSLTGVTGVRQQLPSAIAQQIKLARRYTTKPICVGFGISTPQHVKSLSRIADGVIVGSAIVSQIQHYRGNKQLVPAVSRFVASLAKPLK